VMRCNHGVLHWQAGPSACLSVVSGGCGTAFRFARCGLASLRPRWRLAFEAGGRNAGGGDRSRPESCVNRKWFPRMTKSSLRMLSINFPFKNQSVINERDFSTSRALFDFDVVVVRPYGSVERAGGKFSVQYDLYSRVNAEMEGRIDDVARLLVQGGLLVVLLDALEILQCRTGGYSGGTIYTATNYDFLDAHFYEAVHNGSGDRVDCSTSDPFTKVIKASTVSWTAFMDGRIPPPFHDPTIFAHSGRDAIVGASVPIRSGYVIFLPNFKELDEPSFFDACDEYRSRTEGTPPPDWVQSVHLPGTADILEDIDSFEIQIRELQLQLGVKHSFLDELLNHKKLLFEKGKTQLEPAVLRALDGIGFRTTPSEIIAGTNFEIDGRTHEGSEPGIVEIKGSKKQITFDEFSPLTTKILSDFQVTNTYSKGILVGNGLCLERPEKRLGSVVFSSHVLEAARRNSVALVNSVELYAVLCNVLSGQVTDLNEVRETLLTTNGYADLSGFIVKSPFQQK
jgi:hypothetical protein